MTVQTIVLIAAGVAALIILVVRLAVKQNRRLDQQLHELAASVGGGGIKNVINGRSFSGRYQKFDFACRYFPGSKDSPPALTICLRHAVPGRLRISRESGYDRLAKKIGLAEELQTGDADFDRAFYLDTEQTPFYLQFFQNRERRQAVGAIFAAGYPLRHLEFGKEGVSVKATPLRRLEGFPLSLFLEQLAVLAQGLPDHPSADWPEQGQDADGEARSTRRRAFGLLAAVEAIFLAGGLALLLAGLSTYKPLGAALVWRSLAYSLPAWAFFIWLSFQILKGRSSAPGRFLFLVLFGILAFFTAGCGAMIFANGWLDKEPAKAYVLPVLERYTTRSKDSISYHLVLRHWLPERQKRNLSVPRRFFQGVFPGDRVKLTIKPGHFRQEWLQAIELAESRSQAEK